MKNAKIVKVCEIVVQVCNIATIIAKTLIQAFPVKVAQPVKSVVTPEDVKLIKEFLQEDFK